MSKIKPVIIKKNNLKIVKCFKDILQEEVIYKASPNDFLKGKYPNLVITNVLNKLNNSIHTNASFSDNSSVVELTSDAVTQLLGQKSYDLIMAALCSVINQDVKIKAIMSLLTKKKTTKVSSVATQTEQSSMMLLLREKAMKKHRRIRQAKPYVVTDKLTKVIIYPKQRMSDDLNKSVEKQETCDRSLPDLHLRDEELSNASWGSLGNLSMLSDIIPNSVLNPNFMLNNIDKHTVDYSCDDNAGTLIVKPATQAQSLPCPSNEGNITIRLSIEDRQRLIVQQAIIDLKTCMQRDEDDNLPIHRAVLDDDACMVKRHCTMLLKRGECVDELSGSVMTPLQMSLLNNTVSCTEVLLEYGADMFASDEDGRTCFHVAAESDSDHLKTLIDYCKRNPSEVLNLSEELLESFQRRLSNESVCDFLMHSISTICDSQGYTPLMRASRAGAARAVALLTALAPHAVNMTMPNCGNSALYLAVAAACMDAEDHDDKSKVSENYLKTVETLIVNGADPYLQNSSGHSVNDLLQQMTAHRASEDSSRLGYLTSLCQLIANKITSIRTFKGANVRDFTKSILVKNPNGDIKIESLRSNAELCKPSKPVPKRVTPKVLKQNSDTAHEILNVMPSVLFKPRIIKKEKTKDSKQLKFVKILPKTFVTNKRVNTDTVPTTSKKVKTNSNTEHWIQMCITI